VIRNGKKPGARRVHHDYSDWGEENGSQRNARFEDGEGKERQVNDQGGNFSDRPEDSAGGLTREGGRKNLTGACCPTKRKKLIVNRGGRTTNVGEQTPW